MINNIEERLDERLYERITLTIKQFIGDSQSNGIRATAIDKCILNTLDKIKNHMINTRKILIAIDLMNEQQETLSKEQ